MSKLRLSPSTARIFKECPRKWYYDQIVANKRSTDIRSIEACNLRQLQTIFQWRGSVVDDIISHYLIEKIKYKQNFSDGEIIAKAKNSLREPLEYIKNKINGSTDDLGNYGFFELEYDKDISDKEELIDKIEDEVVTSLTNLLNSELLKCLIEDNSVLIAQRTFRFDYQGFSIGCTPDLVVFPNKGVPTIIDWKVEAIFRDHWQQLGMYAYALSKIKPHVNFPQKWHQYIKDPKNIELIEYQLISNKQHKHKLTSEEVINIENYMHVAINQITKIARSKDKMKFDQFPTTIHPISCNRCKYQKLCWEEMKYDED